MNILRSLYVVAVVCCQCTCVTMPATAGPAPRYRVEITDNPKQKRFIIVLTSLDDRSLCLGIGQWPNRLGQLDFGSSWVELKSGSKSFRPRDTNFGYCPGCEIRVAPRSELKGFIGYAEFADAATIAALPERQLHFPVTAWVCKEQHRK